MAAPPCTATALRCAEEDAAAARVPAQTHREAMMSRGPRLVSGDAEQLLAQRRVAHSERGHAVLRSALLRVECEAPDLFEQLLGLLARRQRHGPTQYDDQWSIQQDQERHVVSSRAGASPPAADALAAMSPRRAAALHRRYALHMAFRSASEAGPAELVRAELVTDKECPLVVQRLWSSIDLDTHFPCWLHLQVRGFEVFRDAVAVRRKRMPSFADAARNASFWEQAVAGSTDASGRRHRGVASGTARESPRPPWQSITTDADGEPPLDEAEAEPERTVEAAVNTDVEQSDLEAISGPLTSRGAAALRRRLVAEAMPEGPIGRRSPIGDAPSRRSAAAGHAASAAILAHAVQLDATRLRDMDRHNTVQLDDVLASLHRASQDLARDVAAAQEAAESVTRRMDDATKAAKDARAAHELLVPVSQRLHRVHDAMHRVEAQVVNMHYRVFALRPVADERGAGADDDEALYDDDDTGVEQVSVPPPPPIGS